MVIPPMHRYITSESKYRAQQSAKYVQYAWQYEQACRFLSYFVSLYRNKSINELVSLLLIYTRGIAAVFCSSFAEHPASYLQVLCCCEFPYAKVICYQQGRRFNVCLLHQKKNIKGNNHLLLSSYTPLYTSASIPSYSLPFRFLSSPPSDSLFIPPSFKNPPLTGQQRTCNLFYNVANVQGRWLSFTIY